MQPKQQKIWRKNFDIKRIDYQMPYVVMEEFYRMQKRFPGRAYITQAIWLTKQGDNIGTYFRKDELRALTDATLRKIIEDPDRADVLHQKTMQYNRQYFALSRRFEKMQWQAMSSRELVSWYERIIALQRMSHGMSLSTTWFLDSDGEDFSKYLLQYCEKKVGEKKNAPVAASVFSVLTTPLRDSLARVEEKDLLRLCRKIQQSKKAFSIMRLRDFKGTDEQCAVLPPAVRKAFVRHYRKWRWVPYTYNGPVYGIDYYAEVVSGLLREKVRPAELLKKYNSVHAENQKAQLALVKKLDIDARAWHLFRIAQDIIYIKGFRKDCLYYGSYARDLLLEEVARRLHITRMQAKYMMPREVRIALLQKRYDVDVLNARMMESVIATHKGRNTIYTGDAAKAFVKKQRFEKEKIIRVKELKGMCACPGKAKGTVKIVNLPEDMVKMQKGDIMLAHTTFPALVPAMKKAAAIVTEDGGITCHAAIVSRELKIPCIVGVKAITQVLKDGDKVQVNATEGTVKKI